MLRKVGGLLLVIHCAFANNIFSKQGDILITKIHAAKNASDLMVTLKVLSATEINISVKNISKHLIRLYSHVNAQEKHFDFFDVEAITLDFREMVFRFFDDRNRSARIIVELKPNESFSHTIDFVAWTKRTANKETFKKVGLTKLPTGTKIRAKYYNTPCENCNEYYKSIWTGSVYSDWVNF